MTLADQSRWDAKYAAQTVPAILSPPSWLIEQATQLPPGRALDLACGLGHAAIWLAIRGWNVTALDISPVGLRLAKQLADEHRVTVDWQLADLDDVDLDIAQYDLITVFRFLDRQSLPMRIVHALRPGGILLYETFVAHSSNTVRNPAFVLTPGELPRLFGGLDVLEYREAQQGHDGLAQLAAIKRIA